MSKPKAKKPTRRERERQLLILAEQVLRELLDYSRPTQTYDFLRQPLVQIATEREVMQLADLGDPIALRMRRTRRLGA